ncbi:tRNA-dihydrouridine synthase [Clostridia bacterium]|nr:tRNA-dihydrouridine synthase [Clostridia bacterium]
MPSLNEPLSLGRLRLDNRVMLAPMAGVTAWPMRVLCRECGCAYAVTEMVSVKSLLYSPADLPALADLLACGPGEKPLALQLFGAEAADFAAVIPLLNDRGWLERFDAIDINMGCPAPKVTKSGAGSALLTDLPRAARIIRAVVSGLEALRIALLVTVKARLAWEDGGYSAVELARIAEDEGASAFIIHGRTRAQQFSGTVDLDGIAAVKAAVSIPVIGNGDITNAADAQRMLSETGCDGLMIGRAAIGNPWIFRRILGGESTPPNVSERLEMALRHARLQVGWQGEARGITALRAQLGWYLKGLPGAALWRARTQSVSSIAELSAIIYEEQQTITL